MSNEIFDFEKKNWGFQTISRKQNWLQRWNRLWNIKKTQSLLIQNSFRVSDINDINVLVYENRSLEDYFIMICCN